MSGIMLIFLISIGFAGIIFADVNIGATFTNDGLEEFHLAIGEFYTVPQKEVTVVREKGVPEDELPVVFYIAARANVTPQAVISLRLKGISWMDISLHFGLGADIYYVETREDIGPPYGKALGHFKNHQRKEWNQIKFTDSEITALVNLKFLSEHYGYSPAQIGKMSGKDGDFVKVNQKVKKDKADKKAVAKAGNKSKGKKKGKK
jgi:hypothetical protein